ncbi:MAG: oxidoreductase domain protein [Myxococcaceae bacterium]|nr:oxidoreductase domain protein [Myxococcaceae bacterium]
MHPDYVRWGILGCGAIATSAIAPAIHWANRNELLAVGSRTLERATRKAAEVGAPRAHGAYEALLADSDIDAIYIGVPNGEHARWAVAAAAAGKHVLCDKSLSLTAGDARAIGEAFRARDLVLVEGFMVRHHPQWTVVRRLLGEGLIGKVQHVRAWLRATLDHPTDHRWSKDLGGGALYDVTCYAVNAARMVVGEEPIRTQATARWTETGVDHSTDALLEFPGGAVASVHGSLRAPFEQGVVISGEKGRIVLDRPFIPHWDPTQIVVELTGADRQVHDIGGANHFLHMFEHVAQCILDRKLPLFPAETGVANVEACAAILDACSISRG